MPLHLVLGIALAGSDVLGLVVDSGPVAGCQPVFWAGVAVVEGDGREARDGVVGMGDAKLGAGLSG